ncbi:MAG TPA: YkgJ family cysteine cluster protein [Alphaproteobacteria bacterium]|nr:YkgJ family cysteine cluster protein [Alphaproteobacteria bacterium]
MIASINMTGGGARCIVAAMSLPSRQQQRAAARERQKSYEIVARRGIPLDDPGGATALVTGRLIAMLADGANPHRASDAAALAQSGFETAMRNNPRPERVACGKGCAHCCDNFVAASAADVLLIARRLREAGRAPAVLERLRAAGERTRGADAEARYLLRVACPLLTAEGACSVYAVRPMACRGLASLALSACEAWAERQPVKIPQPHGHRFFRAAYDRALRAALKATGHSPVGYELIHALTVALERPDAEAAWLAGEDVFAGVQVDPMWARLPADYFDPLIAAARA